MLREGNVARALVKTLEVAPPLELDYEVKPVLLMFGRQAYLIVTNISDKPVHPTELKIAPGDGTEIKMAVPLVIKDHETIKVALPLPLKAGARMELTCAGFGVPRSLRIVK